MVRTFSNNELARSLVVSFRKKKICGIDSNNPDADHGLNFLRCCWFMGHCTISMGLTVLDSVRRERKRPMQTKSLMKERQLLGLPVHQPFSSPPCCDVACPFSNFEPKIFSNLKVIIV